MFNLFKTLRADPVPMLTRGGSAPAKPGQNPSTPGAWLRRTLPSEQDRTLSAESRQWLRRLPSRERPLALCSLYPRVANRLAAVWDDPVQTEVVFDDLMIDRRGGRLGFAPLVASDLMRLHLLHEKRLEPGEGVEAGLADPTGVE